MARDHALAQGLRPDSAVLRLYRWASPTISFGRNEPAVGYRERACATGGLAFVRRPTGGRAVLHDRELTYAVVFPTRALGSLREAYQMVNLGLVQALRVLGVPAELAGRTGQASRPDAGPCFQEAAAGEVTVAGRKLVGSAQARIEGALLQHGSVLLDGDQSMLESISDSSGRASVRSEPAGPGATSLAGLLAKAPAWDDLAEAIIGGLSEVLGGRWGDPTDADQLVDRRAEAELERRYASSAWTWRR